MRRIITGLILIAGAAGAIATGMTGAFFSDTETSTGNVFTAGAIDLLVDNESYYNGNVCAENHNAGVNDPNYWTWQGTAPYPVPDTPCSTSFEPSNLDGLLFFNFLDLKPDDEGEDTISIDVQNDAWICMDLTLTSDDDNSSTEPELEDGDAQEDAGNAWDGELAGEINFFWWADDGDNVYEEGENQITNGVVSLKNLDATFPIALADSENNVWGDVGDPVPGGDTVYIAKAWCLGDLSINNPVTAGLGDNPSVDSGVDCDGTLLNNLTQTDSAELNIIFSAVQARHNDDFLCNPPEEPLPILTVNKALLVSTAGIEVADFELHIDGPVSGSIDDQIVTDEIPVINLPVGTYTVYELITGSVAGKTFTTAFSGACTPSGQNGTVTLGLGDNVVCNILNNEVGDGIGD
ncbi:MAG: hypothetical protein A3C06_04280 [Candidatus Taylorbacteria bacterium RIFCSPHIGHO2_02_FULL_46_13]|uniref:SipW-cognate class signal peptide n=1 Tax=Candidatus Taylorbacteria bacterium RIFCSPHIGHO2_02_FULL_46_13 TaxID=1802312 RepID=A0A1G2MU18_9BACT|nr:MAG: hypothetical protein A3C06_04280 [Candidatus Taylorbacteria bacterium RIFCSPHIGHO2_02_FULL_46_13]